MSDKQQETLEDIISETGLKLEKIASDMGITPNYLWKLRQNPKKMDTVQLEQLANALGVSVNRVFEAIKKI